MKLDIFTLFPEAFDWFRTQRSVRTRSPRATSCGCSTTASTTPLKAGQVDDAPYGGGAGMVLRVDVVDAALQAAYGEGERPRIVLLSPTGPAARRRARRRADRRAARGAALRPLRGLRRARPRAPRRRRGLDRPLRPRRRRAAGDGRRRRADAQAAGCARPRRLARSRSPSARCSRACPSTRTTPARRSIAAGRCRRSCSPATTRRCASGGSSRAAPRAEQFESGAE